MRPTGRAQRPDDGTTSAPTSSFFFFDDDVDHRKAFSSLRFSHSLFHSLSISISTIQLCDEHGIGPDGQLLDPEAVRGPFFLSFFFIGVGVGNALSFLLPLSMVLNRSTSLPLLSSLRE